MPPKDKTETLTRRWVGIIRDFNQLYSDYFNFKICSAEDYQTVATVRNRLHKLESLYDDCYFEINPESIDQDHHEKFSKDFTKLMSRFNAICEKFEHEQMSQEQAADYGEVPPNVSSADQILHMHSNARATEPIQHVSPSPGMASMSIAADQVNQPQTHLISPVAYPPAFQLQNFKLPEIPLPHFNGKFEHWLEFRSTFSSIIVDNTSVADNVKFQYLKQVLSGEALHRVANVPANDFQLAWKLLKQRYDNPMLIADTHVAAILAPPTLNSKSATSWRAFIDHEKLNINALESLDLDIQIKDLLYMYIIISRFDPNTLREWERHNSLKEKPSLDNLWSFMETQHKVAQAMSFNFNNSAHNSIAQTYQKSPTSGLQAKPISQPQNVHNKNSNFQRMFHCVFCKDTSHNIFNCPGLSKLSPAARVDAVKQKRLCINCIKPYTRDHPCWGSCKKCGQPHHTVLHDDAPPARQNIVKSATNHSIQSRAQHSKSKSGSGTHLYVNSLSTSNFDSAQSLTSSPIPSVSEVTPSSSQAQSSIKIPAANHIVNHSASRSLTDSNCSSVSIMPTAEIIVLDREDQPISCRALLDTGSDVSLISEKLASRLALPSIHKNSVIHTISSNETKATVVHSVHVTSSDQKWSKTIDCLVVNKISLNLPPFDLNIEKFNIPSGLKLADPHFHQSKGADILLGASVFAAVMTCGQLTLDPSLPILQNTSLGWIVFGAFQLPQHMPISNHVNSNYISSMEISNQLERFWQIEELSQVAPPTPENSRVEKHYKDTTVRCDDGRFIVSLPRKDNFADLGQSQFQAKKRFNSLENKLAKNSELKAQYVQFMQEYQDLGHMTPVDPPAPEERVYYIPHHAVFKPDSTTTKLRVVFDASAKTNTGVSLNELLYKGPTVQPDLFDIVLRFRIHKIAFTADIAKMYRQVLLDPADRMFHRIFWRDEPSLPLQEFCLNTITYGTTPAAFLATRTLNKLAELEADPNSDVFQSIHRDFYVDDCISGSSTLEHATLLAQQLISLLQKGCFELRKFRSCSTELINSIPSHLVEPSEIKAVSDADSGIGKALGLFWSSTSDKLSIDSNVNEDLHKTSFTKREILSVIASIYDPLGLVNPVVVFPKILLQKLWLLKLGWDDKLPFDLLAEWLNIFRQLPDIAEISIPRCVLSSNVVTDIELHGFSDASSVAYGACVYVRSISNEIQTNLICSKSRIAPLKILTIPRLELQAALLLARLVNRVLLAFKQLNITINQVFLWSDSTTVCSWIRELPERKDIFVAVRVAEIQEATSQFTWNHVKSKENPADIISRGSVPAELCKSELWWHGPAWLAKPNSHWDSFSVNFTVSTGSNVFVTNVVHPLFSNLISRISSPNKLFRVVAYVLRYIHNCRHSDDRRWGELSVSEIQEAETQIIKAIQEEAFGYELHRLRQNLELDSRSSICSLSPFIHEDGLLRVGGRLLHADVPFDFQHQILLPNKHNFTKKLIFSTHQKLSHAGVQDTMAFIRQRFWILSTRRVIKSALRTCIKCFRFSQAKAEQIMGQLPAARVNVTSAFLNVGVDYMGPFSLRLGGPKSRTFSKAHIALFICMATRAVHLEVVTELSTKSFTSALTRFVSIRGIPNSIHSDNGTAFVGANSELQELYNFLANSQNQESLQKSASNLRINWNFIPPRAPHFGGLWERSIRSFKNIFKIVTFKQILNFEEMYTFSAQIGAIMNSRPIVPLSEDPLDLAYLSPGHFLIGRPLNALPVKTVNSKHVNHVQRWFRIADMNKQLWERWSQEYLVTLQKKHKWTTSSDNIKVGVLVLLKDPGAPPAVWKLGRITEVVSGIDGKVRVVMVLTDSGIFKRAISSVAPLPLEDTPDDQI
jgi:hypothetical protein